MVIKGREEMGKDIVVHKGVYLEDLNELINQFAEKKLTQKVNDPVFDHMQVQTMHLESEHQKNELHNTNTIIQFQIPNRQTYFAVSIKSIDHETLIIPLTDDQNHKNQDIMVKSKEHPFLKHDHTIKIDQIMRIPNTWIVNRKIGQLNQSTHEKLTKHILKKLNFKEFIEQHVKKEDFKPKKPNKRAIHR